MCLQPYLSMCTMLPCLTHCTVPSELSLAHTWYYTLTHVASCAYNALSITLLPSWKTPTLSFVCLCAHVLGIELGPPAW
jgi:hypothetical protein